MARPISRNSIITQTGKGRFCNTRKGNVSVTPKGNGLAALLCLCLCAMLLTGCGSNRLMPSDGSNEIYRISKKEFLNRLALSGFGDGVETYYTKNMPTEISAGALGNYSVRSNLYFARGSETVINARLTFPPISLGRAQLTATRARAKSSILSLDFDRELPLDANALLQDALLGRVPAVYGIYRAADFSGFDVRLDVLNHYQLTRSLLGFKTQIEIDPHDMSLLMLKMEYKGQTVVLKNITFDIVDGRKLPTQISISYRGKDGAAYGGTLYPQKVEINGRGKLDF